MSKQQVVIKLPDHVLKFIPQDGVCPVVVTKTDVLVELTSDVFAKLDKKQVTTALSREPKSGDKLKFDAEGVMAILLPVDHKPKTDTATGRTPVFSKAERM